MIDQLTSQTQYIQNCALTTSSGISPSQVRLVTYGIPRSGSTWLYQVCCELLGTGVIKTHDFLDLPGVPVVATIRDPRDAIISHWRFRHADEVQSQGTIGRERMVKLVGLHTMFAGLFLSHLRPALCAGRRVGVVPFTAIIRRPLEVIAAVEWAAGVKFDAQLVQKALNANTIDCNRGRLEPGHVHEGDVGTWESFVSNDDMAEFLGATAPLYVTLRDILTF